MCCKVKSSSIFEVQCKLDDGGVSLVKRKYENTPEHFIVVYIVVGELVGYFISRNFSLDTERGDIATLVDKFADVPDGLHIFSFSSISSSWRCIWNLLDIPLPLLLLSIITFCCHA